MHCETLLALEIAENFCEPTPAGMREAAEDATQSQRGWRQAAEADRLLLLTLGQHCKVHT